MELNGRVTIREKGNNLLIASVLVKSEGTNTYLTLPINFKKDTKEKVVETLKRSKDKDPRLTLDIKGFMSCYKDKNGYNQPKIVALEVSLPKLEAPKVTSVKEDIPF